MERTTESAAAEAELAELTERCSVLSEKGFAVDLRTETERWHRAVRTLGAKKAYALMSRTLCTLYERRFGKAFLFSERTLAFELAYHAEAYFWTQGLDGHARHLSTLLFKREELARHCEVIDISTDDVDSFKQRTMFSYARGVRPCYRNTETDPFDRSTILRRLVGKSKRR